MEVCEHMTPKSPFPNDNYKDFRDYYIQKYNEKITNENQPLLLVKGLSTEKNLYRPVGAEKKRKYEENYMRDTDEYLIPELVVKREFPTELWIQGYYVLCI